MWWTFLNPFNWFSFPKDEPVQEVDNQDNDEADDEADDDESPGEE